MDKDSDPILGRTSFHSLNICVLSLMKDNGVCVSSYYAIISIQRKSPEASDSIVECVVSKWVCTDFGTSVVGCYLQSALNVCLQHSRSLIMSAHT